MPTFTVVLEVTLRGSSAGTTCDEVEADDAAEAERIAIKRWNAARPDRSFRPLLTTQH